MDKIPFPSPADLNNQFVPVLNLSSTEFRKPGTGSIQEFTNNIELDSWVRVLAYRQQESNFSLIMAYYYYDIGIPDQNWNQQTDDGIEYFPDFDETHHHVKFGFEYYSGVYFYKAFSTLDTLAHIMTIMYNLKWEPGENISFYETYKKLPRVNNKLHNKLKAILKTTMYREINKLRNDNTHNYSPGHVSSGVIKEPNIIRLTSGEYTPTSERYKQMKWFSHTVVDIINSIKIR